MTVLKRWTRVHAKAGPANLRDGRWLVCRSGDGRWRIRDQRASTWVPGDWSTMRAAKAWLIANVP